MIVEVIDSGSGSGVALVANPQLILHGFSTAETAGTAATAEVVIRHGNSVSGKMLCAPMNFAADGFGYPTFYPYPIPCPNGIFIQRVSGSTTIVLYVDYQ
jgi:hypothetical protein